MSAESLVALVAVLGMAALVFLIIRNGGKGG
jgi:hypothetical protein